MVSNVFLSSDVRCLSGERSFISMSIQIYQCIKYHRVKKVCGWACCNYFSCRSEGFISDIKSGINWGSSRKQTIAYLWNSVCKELPWQGTRIDTFLYKISYSDHILRRLPFTLTLPQVDHSLKWNSPPQNKNCSSAWMTEVWSLYVTICPMFLLLKCLDLECCLAKHYQD